MEIRENKSEEIHEKIKGITYGEKWECCICLDTVLSSSDIPYDTDNENSENNEKPNNIITLYCCNSIYHTECIQAWAKKKRLCPLCDYSF